MSCFKVFSVFALPFLSSFILSCQPYVDYYSQLQPFCGNLSATRIGTPEYLFPVGYTEECRQALNEAVPFDESFDQAPQSTKDQIQRAIQVLIAYPLAPSPERRLFEAGPNTIPLSLIRIFSPDLSLTNNLNQMAVNYLLNSIDRFDYSPGDGSRLAEFRYKGMGQRVITIYDSLISSDYTPTTTAAILMHEARHSDGIAHAECLEGEKKGKTTCDHEFFGAYGLELVYLNYLLIGSMNLRDTDGEYVLTTTELPHLTNHIMHSFLSIQGVQHPSGLEGWTAPTNDYFSKILKYRTR